MALSRGPTRPIAMPTKKRAKSLQRFPPSFVLAPQPTTGAGNRFQARAATVAVSTSRSGAWWA